MLHVSCFPLHETAPPLFAETASVAFNPDMDITTSRQLVLIEGNRARRPRAGAVNVPTLVLANGPHIGGRGIGREAAPLTTEGPPVNDAEVAGALEGGQLPQGGAESEEVRGTTTLDESMLSGLRRPIAGSQVAFQRSAGLRAGQQETPRDRQIGDTWRGLGEVVAALVDGTGERKPPRPRCRVVWL